MSHWVIMPIGAVREILAGACQTTNVGGARWIEQTAAEIERRGNLNPSHGGFILLPETPVDGRLTVRVLLHSIDHQMMRELARHPVLEKIRAQNKDRYYSLRTLAERHLFAVLSQSLAAAIFTLQDVLFKAPRTGAVGLTDDERLTVEELLETAAELTPPCISFLHLFVEGTLHRVLGRENPYLVAFDQLAPVKQAAAKREIIRFHGLEALYPEILEN